MLSVHRLGAGAEGYYLDQVVAGVEDYYAGVGEAPGEWLASSGLLGLDGRVDPKDLRAVLKITLVILTTVVDSRGSEAVPLLLTVAIPGAASRSPSDVYAVEGIRSWDGPGRCAVGPR